MNTWKCRVGTWPCLRPRKRVCQSWPEPAEEFQQQRHQSQLSSSQLPLSPWASVWPRPFSLAARSEHFLSHLSWQTTEELELCTEITSSSSGQFILGPSWTSEPKLSLHIHHETESSPLVSLVWLNGVLKSLTPLSINVRRFLFKIPVSSILSKQQQPSEDFRYTAP